MDLTIDVADFSPRKLFAALDQPFPVATADPKALSGLAFSARLKADQTSLAVSDGKLKLDDSNLNLVLKIVNFSKPDLAFDLTLDRIDADRHLPSKYSAPQNDGRPAEKSTVAASKTAPPPAAAPIALPAALAAVDARLQAGKVIINQKTIEDIRITLTANTGPIKLALAARLPEGPLTVSGSIGPFGADAGR